MVNRVLLCPGQGSQRVGMGRDVAERFPAARQVFEEIDDALGMSLTRIMWEGPDRDLTLTHNAQPAILAHTLAVYAVVGDMVAPVFGAGHSLGEYSAYAAAGTLSVADAARLVRRRGELMLEAGDHRAGAMAAVIGLDVEQVVRCCAEASNDQNVAVVANFNSRDQLVISGDPEAVERASALCKDARAKRVVSLKVSGAFHSPLMEPARECLRKELNRIDFSDPKFPIIANATAEIVTRGAVAAELLAQQMTSPVRWVESMERAAAGMDEEMTFVEVGPGIVLAGLLRKILKGRRIISLGSGEEVAAFLEQRR